MLGLVAVVACDRTPTAARSNEPASAGLPAVDGVANDTFTSPDAFVELSDGRVIISDPPHGELWAVDFTSGDRTPFGRRGDGPGEFRYVQQVIRLAGDSLAVVSTGPQVRVAILAPDGVPTRTLTLDSDPSSAATINARGYTEWPAQPEYSDAAGHLYGARPRLPLGMEFEPTALGEYQLVRVDPGTGRTDSVGRVPASMDGTRPRALNDGSGFEIDLLPGPFTAQMAWTILGDGTLVIVDGEQYDVTFQNGDSVRDVRVPAAQVNVTPEAWARYTDTAAPSLQQRMRGGVPMDGPAGVPPRWEVRVPPPPTAMPSTLAGPRRRLLTDGRDVWVPVPQPGPDPLANERWDVIDARGERRMTLELPARTVLLGVSTRFLYTATIDDDELRTVRRHPRAP
jgi:hypothetical protein